MENVRVSEDRRREALGYYEQFMASSQYAVGRLHTLAAQPRLFRIPQTRHDLQRTPNAFAPTPGDDQREDAMDVDPPNATTSEPVVAAPDVTHIREVDAEDLNLEEVEAEVAADLARESRAAQQDALLVTGEEADALISPANVLADLDEVVFLGIYPSSTSHNNTTVISSTPAPTPNTSLAVPSPGSTPTKAKPVVLAHIVIDDDDDE